MSLLSRHLGPKPGFAHLNTPEEKELSLLTGRYDMKLLGFPRY